MVILYRNGPPQEVFSARYIRQSSQTITRDSQVITIIPSSPTIQTVSVSAGQRIVGWTVAVTSAFNGGGPTLTMITDDTIVVPLHEINQFNTLRVAQSLMIVFFAGGSTVGLAEVVFVLAS